MSVEARKSRDLGQLREQVVMGRGVYMCEQENGKGVIIPGGVGDEVG
jgi:hypothetical protein